MVMPESSVEGSGFFIIIKKSRRNTSPGLYICKKTDITIVSSLQKFGSEWYCLHL